jgi:metal-responsive CopG/Arc/MetJ family transcriptional regulator
MGKKRRKGGYFSPERPQTVVFVVKLSKPLMESVDILVERLKLWSNRAEFVREAIKEHVERYAKHQEPG